MHPALNVSNFSRLPLTLRKRAEAAVSGSHEEIMSLFDDPENIAPAHLRSLLPVPYSVLNPARIPEILAQFDTSGWRSIRRYIFQAHTSIRSILVLFSSEAIPLGASVDLWEAVWPWIAFLNEYEQSLSSGKDSIGEESPNAYKRYLALIRYLEKDETARQLIYSTAGLYVVVGRAWPYLIHADAETLYSVSHFLAQWFGPDQWNPAAYEDVIVGCGGSRMDLATLIVSQIQRMLPRPDSTVTENTVLHLIGVLCIGHEPDPELDDALLSCGIVTALTTASRALCRCHLDIAETVVKGFLPALVLNHISSFPPIWLPESLRAGLLEIVFTRYHWKAISPFVDMLLKDVLLPATVYHSVLVQLRISISQVRNMNMAAIFRDNALLALWKNLVEVAERRFRIVDKYSDGTLTAPRGCDDPECAKICPKHDLKRCGGCLTTYYCSQTCQTNHWGRGGHRWTCGDLSLRQERDYARYSSRDRSFLRALTYHEYTTRREEIASTRLIRMQQYPGQIMCLLFDFTQPTCEIAVGPLEGLIRLGPFESEVEQTTRSEGRIELHLMRVQHGVHRTIRIWPFPLRVGSA
ncbi:hypothetical protein C8R45DRAFT_1019527 [Mycena sanguinolenta]|nr:hypothetical protein C8R45DRAFT_1019527 [Mycena sanguinolenta]